MKAFICSTARSVGITLVIRKKADWQNGIGTVAQSNFLTDLRSVDVVHLDVMLSEVALHLVRNEVDELLAVEDGVEQEGTVVAQTTCHIVHMEISLYVASHEVRRVDPIRAADRLVTEARGASK